jgi:hypothetical protein
MRAALQLHMTAPSSPLSHSASDLHLPELFISLQSVVPMQAHLTPSPGVWKQLNSARAPTLTASDAFAGEWTAGAFADAGARYEKSPHPKSTLYLESLPAFNRGAVSVPDHPTLLKELRALERRVHRSGKDTVDHGRRGSDDYANSLAGAMYIAFRETRRPKMRQGAIGVDGSVAWKDNGTRPRLRFEAVSEKEAMRQKEEGTW